MSKCNRKNKGEGSEYVRKFTNDYRAIEKETFFIKE